MPFAEWDTGFDQVESILGVVKDSLPSKGASPGRGHAPFYTDELSLVLRRWMRALRNSERPLLQPSPGATWGSAAQAQGKRSRRVPEGATEEAGDKEARQARQVFQEVHHKVENELQAEQKCTAPLREEPCPEVWRARSPLHAPLPVCGE